MDAFSSPLRLIPPLTPRRAPSPTMSPGGRRGRAYGSSEEGRLRDLSPETTLRAFSHKPMPFDTTRDEYKIFSCIETLTAAERDLGARVAKAAQRLKSWCAEIEQWGWSSSFEQPSEDYRERRRRSIELRIREHVAEGHFTDALPPLEYWGSLLSVEVEQHEARLDDIEEDLLKLDIEELKEHVLDMHPAGRSRPSSAGLGASRQNYRPMDDFSFLITQTLLSALPQHAQLKERLNTWTARVSILREAPRFASDLKTARNAMRLGWDAIEPPTDTSDLAFTQWREAVNTISGVLQGKVADLGSRLDRMLDTLEGCEDCLPEDWIDTFEDTEADYGRWSQESRRRVIEFDICRKGGMTPLAHPNTGTNQEDAHSDGVSPPGQQQPVKVNPASGAARSSSPLGSAFTTSPAAIANVSTNHHGVTTPKRNELPSKISESLPSPATPLRRAFPDIFVKSTPEQPNHEDVDTIEADPPSANAREAAESSLLPDSVAPDFSHASNETQIVHARLESDQITKAPLITETNPNLITSALPLEDSVGVGPASFAEEWEFEEGDTIVHNEVGDTPDHIVPAQMASDDGSDGLDAAQYSTDGSVQPRPRPLVLSDSSVITATNGQDNTASDPPQTPRSRRGSIGSLSSDMSFESSPSGNIEESPSVRNATNRPMRAPRPELNAAMTKRRPAKTPAADIVPWPPTSFTQKPVNSAEDLERKISDILTTIPAHIRLTSGPSPDSPEVKPRGLATKGSRGYLRAARSASGLKSPELTLSPAKNDFESANVISGRKSAANLRADNDIKLYHLTQPGKEQPVKLFIRRVGENGERVMVRVGGGWADLGEYLRQYAEHHGRRTASDGKFEILGLEVNNQNESPNRPESVAGRRDRRISGGLTATSPTNTPGKSSSLNLSNDEAPLPMSNINPTPGIAEEASIPSTNSSQRSWKGNEVGLAGPNAKKMDLSEEKREWIEGMMKQARTVSGQVITANHTPFQREERADSRSDSRSDSRASNRAGGKKKEFGDLGKVGGTKRIFLKGGKPYVADA
jgi:hypothetical protein